MHNQIKSGGVPKGFARLPIRARKLSRSTFLLLLLLFSCQKIDLTPEDTPVPDGSGLSDTLPTEIIEVEAIPTPCTLWQGHIVALVEPINGSSATPPFKEGWEGLVTLLSLHEWSNLPSALHATNPTEASTLARGYQEYDLPHWRIPTATQAKALKAAYPAVTVPEGLPLSPDARYLCEEGTKSFSFAPGTTISTAGTKATTYRLRLVKTLHLKQK